MRTINGLLNINKPRGLTSRDVVDRVVRTWRSKRAGHAGTLDPLATGVLIVCVGSATRLVEYVQRMRKTYRTTIRLGARSDTYDADGRIVEATAPTVPGEAAVRQALATQVGTIAQHPPAFSALKVAGQRAYNLARKGRDVVLAARPVTIHRIDLLAYAWPALELEVECGSGTYIRSIAHDLGEALGCGGLVEVLVRTRIGPFSLADAIDLSRLEGALLADLIRPATEAVAELPQRVLCPDELSRIVQGQSIQGELGATPADPGGDIALLAPDGSLVAIAEHDPGAGRVHPRRLLGP
jgi:tRNA pseudouridine55 synthase